MEGDGPYAIAGRSGGSRRSVREAIELAKPVEGIITDRFDIRNGNFGVRIAAAASDRITAIDNGTVVLSLWTPETGYMVELQHANNLLSVYKGLSQSLVTTGQTIRAGEMVGYNAEAEEGEVRLNSNSEQRQARRPRRVYRILTHRHETTTCNTGFDGLDRRADARHRA